MVLTQHAQNYLQKLFLKRLRYMFTEQEKNLLHIIQNNFPLRAQPYAAIGRRLGMRESAVLISLESLKQRKLLKEIRAIFDARFLGFQSALIAFKLEEARLAHAANVINLHPGVSHNYQRLHPYNLWFTLVVPQDIVLETHVQTLADLTACQQYFVFPSLRTFKRRVQFILSDSVNSRQKSARVQAIRNSSQAISGHSDYFLLPQDAQQHIMSMLHNDLSLSSEPFCDIARRCSVKNDHFFDFVSYLLASQKMSRFAGILYHRNVGFTANAMVVWNVPASIMLPFVEEAVSSPAISHCYERSTYPEWPYNVYTMCHGTSQRRTQEVIEKLAATFTIGEYEVLYSGTEYKKHRVNYFGQDIYEWDQRYVKTRRQDAETQGSRL